MFAAFPLASEREKRKVEKNHEAYSDERPWKAINIP
jgi:hypothetical protein